MNVLLYSEINKQNSQLRIHAYESKNFFPHLRLQKKKVLEGICKISHKMGSVGRFRGIRNGYSFPWLWSHRAGLEPTVPSLADCVMLSELLSFSNLQFSHFCHGDNDIYLESLKYLV